MNAIAPSVAREAVRNSVPDGFEEYSGPTVTFEDLEAQGFENYEGPQVTAEQLEAEYRRSNKASWKEQAQQAVQDIPGGETIANLAEGAWGGIREGIATAGSALWDSFSLPGSVRYVNKEDATPEQLELIKQREAQNWESYDKIKDFIPSAEGVLDPEKDGWDKFAYSAGEVLPGAVGGGAAGLQVAKKVLPNAVKLVPRMAKGFIAGAGADVGSALTMDPEAETLVYGQNSLMEDWLGWDFDGGKDENEPQSVMGKKAELAIDNLITGLVLNPLSAGVEAILGFGTRKAVGGTKIYNTEAQKKIVAKEVLDQLSGVDLMNDTLEVANSKRQSFMEVVANRENIDFDFSKVDPTLENVSLPKNLLDLKKETINHFYNKEFAVLQAAKKSGDISKEVYDQGVQNLATYRSSELADIAQMETAIRAGGAQTLEASIEKESRALQHNLRQMKANRGGNEAVEQAADNIRTAGNRTLEPLEDKINQAILAKDSAEEELKEIVSADPFLAEQFKQAAADVNLDVTTLRTDTGNAVVDRLFETYKEMDATRRSLWEAIPDEATGNTEVIQQVLSDLGAEATDFGKKVLAAGDNFKAIDQLGRSRELKGLIAQNPEYLSLREALTSAQIKHLEDSGQAQASDAIEEAVRYFKEEFVAWKDNPILKNIADASAPLVGGDQLNMGREALDSGLNKMSNQPTRIQGGGQTTDSVADILGRTDDTGLLVDRVKADISTEISRMARMKEFTPENLSAAISKFDSQSGVLRKYAPKQYESIQNTLSRIKQIKGLDGPKLDREIAQLDTQLKAARKDLTSNLLKDFYDSGEIKGARESFEGLLTGKSPERVRKVMQLVKEAGPEVESQVRAAYADVMEKTLFKTTDKSQTGALIVNKGTMSALADKGSSFYKNAEAVLGEEGADTLSRIAKEVYEVVADSSAKQQDIMAKQAVDVQSLKDTNTLITWIFGILNPMAARIRTITNDLAKSNSSKDNIQKFIVEFMVNPEEFLQYAKKVKPSSAQTVAAKRNIRKALYRAGVIQLQGEDDEVKALLEEAPDDRSALPGPRKKSSLSTMEEELQEALK